MDMLVIMDAFESFDSEGDTSLGLMAAGLERGHRVSCCTAGNLSWIDGQVVARVRRVTAGAGHMVAGPFASAPQGLCEFDVVVVRTDPPFDADYLAMTLLLEFARGSTLVVNDPRALRESNEKLYALRFPELMPATVVTADVDDLCTFADEHGGAVLKPLDGHGGDGVVRLRVKDPRGDQIVSEATGGGARPVMAQEFLAKVVDGDRRILLLDGEPLGALNRVPARGEFRANISRGARVEVAEIQASDRRIIDTLAPALRRDGLWFVGIDVIDGRLSEINVTSPTGLRQLTRGSGKRPDLTVIDWFEARTQ